VFDTRDETGLGDGWRLAAGAACEVPARCVLVFECPPRPPEQEPPAS
jgi:hypothetical protein